MLVKIKPEYYNLNPLSEKYKNVNQGMWKVNNVKFWHHYIDYTIESLVLPGMILSDVKEDSLIFIDVEREKKIKEILS